MYNCHGGRWLWWVICLFIPTLITITLFTWLDTSKDTYEALSKPDWVPKWSFIVLAFINTAVSVVEGVGLSMFAAKQDIFDGATWTPLFLALTLYKTAFFAYILSLLYFVQILLTFLIACLAAVSAFIVLGLFVKLYDFAGILMLPSALWFSALSVFSYYIWSLNK